MWGLKYIPDSPNVMYVSQCCQLETLSAEYCSLLYDNEGRAKVILRSLKALKNKVFLLFPNPNFVFFNPDFPFCGGDCDWIDYEIGPDEYYFSSF